MANSEWQLPTRLGRVKISDQDEMAPRVADAPQGLFVEEAERLVEGLRRFELKDVGSKAWMSQHQAIERLNQQAHQSARERSDEFVLEAMLTFDKMEVLIYDLVLIEAWREHVYPKLKTAICGGTEHDLAARRLRCRTLRAYFVLYHEATVVNFLEVLCYHAHALGSAREAMLDLLDYCARRLARLQLKCADFRQCGLAPSGRSAKEWAAELERTTPQEELERQELEIEFAASVSCVALVRFVCQHIGELSVSAVTRLVETHDLLLSIVPLIDNPPWTRKQSGVWEKLDEGEWRVVAPDRLLELTKLEAQAWLALYYLAMHPEVRKRYGFDSYRKQTLMRARRFITAVLLDQLPILAELQRFVDELAIVDVPEPTSIDRGGYLLMEQIAGERDRVMRGADFDAIAAKQRDTVWRPRDASSDADLVDLVDVYTGQLDDLPVEVHDLTEMKHDAGVLAETKHDAGAIAETKRNADVIAETKHDAGVLAETKRDAGVLAETKHDAGVLAETKRDAETLAETKRDADGIHHSIAEPPEKSNLKAEPPEKSNANAEPTADEEPANLESVSLISGDEVLILERCGPVKVVPGPDGREYDRVKWTGSAGIVLDATSSVSIAISWSSGEESRLEGSLSLPTDIDTDPPRKIWRQIGDCGDEFAAQLLLVLELPHTGHRPTYKARDLFLSTPHFSD